MHRFTVETVIIVVVVALQSVTSFELRNLLLSPRRILPLETARTRVRGTWAEEAYIRPILPVINMIAKKRTRR